MSNNESDSFGNVYLVGNQSFLREDTCDEVVANYSGFVFDERNCPSRFICLSSRGTQTSIDGSLVGYILFSNTKLYVKHLHLLML